MVVEQVNSEFPQQDLGRYLAERRLGLSMIIAEPLGHISEGWSPSYTPMRDLELIKEISGGLRLVIRFSEQESGGVQAEAVISGDELDPISRPVADVWSVALLGAGVEFDPEPRLIITGRKMLSSAVIEDQLTIRLNSGTIETTTKPSGN